MKMSLKTWYGTSVRIPNYETYWFHHFVSTSMGIVRTIIQDNLDKDIFVKFGAVGTAAADIEKGIIYIEQGFLSGRFVNTGPLLTSDETIVCLMGIVVHEAGHFAYSPPTLEPWGDYIQANIQPEIPFSRNVAQTIGNIIEDVFIEAELNRTLPLLSWTLETLNDVFFPEEEYALRLLKVSTTSSPPQKGEELTDLLNFLILAKTRSESESTSYVMELFNLMRSAATKPLIADRMQLALLVYERVMSDMKKSNLPSGLSEIQAKSLGAGASHDKKTIRSVAEDGGGETVNKISKTSQNSRIRLPFDFPGVSETTLFFKEEVVTPANFSLKEDKRYMELAQIAKQRAAVNRPYGLDKKRGNNIRKLYRISTDQRIFADTVKVSNYAPMQVLVLVDCSGSMLWGAGNSIPIRQALEAGIGTIYALSAGRSSVALYGHTSDPDGITGATVIYRVKGFNEPLTKLAQKAAHLSTSGYSHSGNRDGDAILYVSKAFLGKQTERLLIVISDGQPNADRYNGVAAISHCKRVVDGLREEGIKVLSISIEEEAGKINDQIYGKENNVFNEDPGVIKDIIRRIITE